MSDIRIAVILGRTRPGRNGKGAVDWVMTQAADREVSYDRGVARICKKGTS